MPKALDLIVDMMSFHSLLDPVLWEQVLHLLMDAKVVGGCSQSDLAQHNGMEQCIGGVCYLKQCPFCLVHRWLHCDVLCSSWLKRAQVTVQ